MNNKQSNLEESLLSLAEEKLKCLQALKKSLHLFYDTMEDSDQDEILSQIEIQSVLMDQINRIDEKYQLVQETISNGQPVGLDEITKRLEWHTDLDSKLKEQHGLLVEISSLNERAKAKAQALSNTFKQKIKAIDQQKNLLSNFNLFDKKQTGNLYDYKEGR